MLQTGLLVAAVLLGAMGLLYLASSIILTFDKLQSYTLIGVYAAVVGVLLLTLVGTTWYLLRPRRSRRQRMRPRRSPLDRLRDFYAEHDLDDSRPVAQGETAQGGISKPPIGRTASSIAAPVPPSELYGRRVVVGGVKGVGKSAVARMLEETGALPTAPVEILELPAFTANIAENQRIAASARAGDVVVFVADQDLREYEFHTLEHLADRNTAIIVALNKSDTLRAREREEIKQSVLKKVAGLVPEERVVAVAAAPAPILRIVTRADGAEEQEEHARAPEGSALFAQVGKLLQ